MNINQFVPKHIDIDAERANAPHYEGSFTELYNLVKAGKVTSVTRNGGEVVGIYVDAGMSSVMLEEVAGQNFQSAYCCKPVMEWYEIIITAKYTGKEITEINEDLGTCKVGDEVVTFSERNVVTNSEELPTEVEISCDDIGEKDIATYLRDTYDHYLSGNSESKFEYSYDEDADVIRVTGINWGRKR